jgi:hypothetical protein
MNGAKPRRFVESHLPHWQGARALYRQGGGVSLVQLDDVIATTRQGLSTVRFLLPTPGLRDTDYVLLRRPNPRRCQAK